MILLHREHIRIDWSTLRLLDSCERYVPLLAPGEILFTVTPTPYKGQPAYLKRYAAQATIWDEAVTG